MNTVTMQIIARMKSDFPEKFGIPRQSSLVKELRSTIIFEPEFQNPDALRGLEDYSHLWISWLFSENLRTKWSPTVRPPRLGGNTRMGVFATRSPFRPNAIGLSSVRILGIEHTTQNGTVIHVAGADLMDGTPILDIKPYIPYTDCHSDATGGFTDGANSFLLDLEFPTTLLERIPSGKQDALKGVLTHDPRPSYQHDPDRIYGIRFSKWNIRFQVNKKTLTVLDVTEVE